MQSKDFKNCSVCVDKEVIRVTITSSNKSKEFTMFDSGMFQKIEFMLMNDVDAIEQSQVKKFINQSLMVNH